MILRSLANWIVYSRGFFQGILFWDWMKLLVENRFRIGGAYRIKIPLITLFAVLNSIIAFVERFRYGKFIRKTNIKPPVFILGVWRSGTTHLCNLLAQDKRFGFSNYVQTMNPHTFLTIEKQYSKLVDFVAPKTRGIDNVLSGSNQPEEDEYALLVLTTLSYQLDSVFPKRTGFYNRFLTFRNASTREIDDWKNALVFFVRKLTFRYGGRPIVLKSPAHTSRIRMILDIFPDAKFVLIHRNPFEVYLSYMHMLHKYLKGYGLNKLDETVASNHTILVYREMINAFFEEKHFIPEANYHEIRYDDLINDPSGELQKAYEKLALPDFKEYESDLKAYLSTIADYKKNELPNLPGDLQEKLFVEWKRYFTEWNYPMKVSEPKE